MYTFPLFMSWCQIYRGFWENLPNSPTLYPVSVCGIHTGPYGPAVSWNEAGCPIEDAVCLSVRPASASISPVGHSCVLMTIRGDWEGCWHSCIADFAVDTLSCVALSLKGMYERTFFLRFSKNAHFIHYHTFFRNVPWVVKGYLDENCRLLKVEMVSCLTLQWSMWSDLLRSKSSKVNSLDLFAHIVARIRPCKAFNFTHVLGFKEAYLTLSKGIHLICFWQSSKIAAYSLPPLPLPAEKEKSVSEEEKTVDRFLKVPPLMVIKFGLIFSFFLLISSPHLCAATLSFS